MLAALVEEARLEVALGSVLVQEDSKEISLFLDSAEVLVVERVE